MQKRGRSKVQLSPAVEKAARNFCTANNLDMETFLEEAIMEKIEYEETNIDVMQYESAEEPAVVVMEDDGFKRKH